MLLLGLKAMTQRRPAVTVQTQLDHFDSFTRDLPRSSEDTILKVTGNLAPSGIDTYTFEAQAGTTYKIESIPGTLSNTALVIIDRDGRTFLAVDDDGGAGYISWEAPASGTYHLGVTNYFGFSGSYELTVNEVIDLTVGTPVSQTINSSDTENPDVDFFGFEAVAGTEYLIETTVDTVPGSLMGLFDRDGTTPLEVDSTSGENGSKISWTAPASGTYSYWSRILIELVFRTNCLFPKPLPFRKRPS